MTTQVSDISKFKAEIQNLFKNDKKIQEHTEKVFFSETGESFSLYFGRRILESYFFNEIFISQLNQEDKENYTLRFELFKIFKKVSDVVFEIYRISDDTEFENKDLRSLCKDFFDFTEERELEVKLYAILGAQRNNETITDFIHNNKLTSSRINELKPSLKLLKKFSSKKYKDYKFVKRLLMVLNCPRDVVCSFLPVNTMKFKKDVFKLDITRNIQRFVEVWKGVGFKIFFQTAVFYRGQEKSDILRELVGDDILNSMNENYASDPRKRLIELRNQVIGNLLEKYRNESLLLMELLSPLFVYERIKRESVEKELKQAKEDIIFRLEDFYKRLVLSSRFVRIRHPVFGISSVKLSLIFLIFTFILAVVIVTLFMIFYVFEFELRPEINKLFIFVTLFAVSGVFIILSLVTALIRTKTRRLLKIFEKRQIEKKGHLLLSPNVAAEMSRDFFLELQESASKNVNITFFTSDENFLKRFFSVVLLQRKKDFVKQYSIENRKTKYNEIREVISNKIEETQLRKLFENIFKVQSLTHPDFAFLREQDFFDFFKSDNVDEAKTKQVSNFLRVKTGSKPEFLARYVKSVDYVTKESISISILDRVIKKDMKLHKDITNFYNAFSMVTRQGSMTQKGHKEQKEELEKLLRNELQKRPYIVSLSEDLYSQKQSLFNFAMLNQTKNMDLRYFVKRYMRFIRRLYTLLNPFSIISPNELLTGSDDSNNGKVYVGVQYILDLNADVSEIITKICEEAFEVLKSTEILGDSLEIRLRTPLLTPNMFRRWTQKNRINYLLANRLEYIPLIMNSKNSLSLCLKNPILQIVKFVIQRSLFLKQNPLKISFSISSSGSEFKEFMTLERTKYDLRSYIITAVITSITAVIVILSVILNIVFFKPITGFKNTLQVFYVVSYVIVLVVFFAFLTRCVFIYIQVSNDISIRDIDPKTVKNFVKKYFYHWTIIPEMMKELERSLHSEIAQKFSFIKTPKVKKALKEKIIIDKTIKEIILKNYRNSFIPKLHFILGDFDEKIIEEKELFDEIYIVFQNLIDLLF
jgi:hypothetical protein